jgi:putative membrane protein
MAAGVAAALGLAAPALGQGTGSSSAYGTGSSSTGTGSATSAKASSKELSKDLVEAAQKLHADNQGEQQMAQHAQQMAQSSQVKQYAKKIEQDHAKNDQKLRTLASGMGVQLTGEAFDEEQKDAQDKMKDLHSKQGAEFDKAYIDQMVDEHEKDIGEVKDAAKKAREENHPQFASFLDQTQAGLKAHLQEAKQIQKGLENQKASSGTGSGAAGSGGGTGGSSGTGSAGGSTSGAGGSGGGTGGGGG